MSRHIVHTLLFLQIALACAPLRLQHDLAHLPRLIEHFQEHRATDPQLSFAAFWALHYGDRSEQHAAQHDHSELPCKKHDAAPMAHFAPGLAFFQEVSELILRLELPEGSRLANAFFEKTAHPAVFVDGIWQPPRLV